MNLSPEKIKDLISFTDYYISTHNKIPTETDLKTHLTDPSLLTDLITYLHSKIMVIKLRALGYSESHLYNLYQAHDPHSLGLNPTFQNSLTQQQLDLISSLTDPTDPRPNNRKLRDLNIPSSAFQAWLRDPNFNQHLLTQVTQLAQASRVLALNALSIKAANGDPMSIMQIAQIVNSIPRSPQPHQQPISRPTAIGPTMPQPHGGPVVGQERRQPRPQNRQYDPLDHPIESRERMERMDRF